MQINRREFIQRSIATGTALALPSLQGKTNRAQTSDKPNVLFVMTDQWRAQALGKWGTDPVKTPVLDKFGDESVVCMNTIAQCPICTPNRGIMMTGCLPQSTGIINNFRAIPTEQAHMGTLFKEAGYDTGYIGKWHLDGHEPYRHPSPPETRKGWDTWIMSRGHIHFELKYQMGDTAVVDHGPGWQPTFETDRAIDFIKTKRNNPFALVVSYNPPHNGLGKGFDHTHMPGSPKKGGYAAPSEWEALYSENRNSFLNRKNVKPVSRLKESAGIAVPGYFGSISSIDHEFGRLLNTLREQGLEENTLVVFTSDHGEMLGSQSLMTKGIWFEESLKVPFFIRSPKRLKHRVLNTTFGSADFLPTILEGAGLEQPEQLDGKSRWQWMCGNEAESERELPLSFHGGSDKDKRDWRGLRNSRYTYVCTTLKVSIYKHFSENQGEILYDNESDPYQMEPIFRGQGNDTIMDAMQSRLKTELAKLDDPFMETSWKHTLQKVNKNE